MAETPRFRVAVQKPRAVQQGGGSQFNLQAATYQWEMEALTPIGAEIIEIDAETDAEFTAQVREFDAVIAPYHDVGMTAIKVAAFGRGVNVTLGLPIVRTAPDHGTAFDIAGQGRADAGSLIAAITLAARLAERARGR